MKEGEVVLPKIQITLRHLAFDDLSRIKANGGRTGKRGIEMSWESEIQLEPPSATAAVRPGATGAAKLGPDRKKPTNPPH